MRYIGSKWKENPKPIENLRLIDLGIKVAAEIFLQETLRRSMLRLRFDMTRGRRTGVWWDLNTCPVPDGFDPCSVRTTIESALTKYSGEPHRVTICAVGNLEYVSAELLEALSSSGIIFCHTPFGLTSVHWLLSLWEGHTPPPAEILLISSNPSWFMHDSLFVPSGYNVHRAFPKNQRPSLAPSSGGKQWDWVTLFKKYSKGGSVEETNLSRPIDQPGWFCFVCDMYDMRDSFESCSSFVEHLKSEEHRLELFESVRRDEDGVPVRLCKLCNYPGYDDVNMEIHFNSDEHKQKLFAADENDVPVPYCTLCNYPGYDDYNMDIHYNSAQHKQKEKENEEEKKKNKRIGTPSSNWPNKKMKCMSPWGLVLLFGILLYLMVVCFSLRLLWWFV